MRALKGIVYSPTPVAASSSPARRRGSRFPRGRRPPVDQRQGSASRPRPHLCRAVLRARARMAAARRARPDAEPTARRSTCGSPPRPSIRRHSLPPRRATARRGCAPTSSPAASGCASPAIRGPRRDRGCGAIVPEALAPPTSSPRGRRRGDSALPLLARPALPGLAGRRTAPLRAGPRRPSHLERLLTPDERGLPVVTVIDGSSHALAFVGSRPRHPLRPARRRPLRPDRSQPEVYAEYGIDADAIATAALVALEPTGSSTPRSRGR